MEERPGLLPYLVRFGRDDHWVAPSGTSASLSGLEWLIEEPAVCIYKAISSFLSEAPAVCFPFSKYSLPLLGKAARAGLETNWLLLLRAVIAANVPQRFCIRTASCSQPPLCFVVSGQAFDRLLGETPPPSPPPKKENYQWCQDHCESLMKELSK